MNRMTGLFMGLGAILLFVVFAFLYPDLEEGLEQVEALMENRTLSTFYLFCGIVAFTMMQSGLINSCWMQTAVTKYGAHEHNS